MGLKNNKQFGFTLIELLVVVAIIGLLTSIISVAFTNSRMKSRDTKRVTDMKQIKTGMDIYFANGNGYPTDEIWVANTDKMLSCQGKDAYRIPRDPSYPNYQYTYTATGQTNPNGCGPGIDTRSGYQIQFYIENKEAFYIMDDDGNVTDASGNPVSFDSLL